MAFRLLSAPGEGVTLALLALAVPARADGTAGHGDAERTLKNLVNSPDVNRLMDDYFSQERRNRWAITCYVFLALMAVCLGFALVIALLERRAGPCPPPEKGPVQGFLESKLPEELRPSASGHVFSLSIESPTVVSEGLGDEPRSPPRLGNPMRECAKCGSTMTLQRVERVFRGGGIYYGKRMYFRCAGCGAEIMLRSLWRNTLIFAACIFWAMWVWWFVTFPDWTSGLLALFFGSFPLVLVLEIVTRIRYPRVRASCQIPTDH
jgi:hypothetical protein